MKIFREVLRNVNDPWQQVFQLPMGTEVLSVAPGRGYLDMVSCFRFPGSMGRTKDRRNGFRTVDSDSMDRLLWRRRFLSRSTARGRKLLMKAALQWAAVIITANIASSLSAPPAHADPTDDLVHDSAMFCREMDRDSTPAGVKSHIEDMYADGLDVETAKSVVGYALSAICPEYEDEVEAAAALYAPKLEMA